MKVNFKTSILGLGVIAGGLLSSCTADYEPSAGTANGMLAKAPVVKAYSGDHFWGTRGSNMNANMWGDTYDCPVRDAEDLTPEELEELKALLSPGKPVENTIVINFEEYWVQQIFKGDSQYDPDDVFGNACTGQTITGSNQMDHFEVLGKYGYERVENFDRGNNTNHPGNCSACGESHFGTTLKVDMPTDNTDPTNQFRYWESYGSDNYFNYIIVEYKGYYYLGFDYQMEKEANNPNEADHVDRDWNFTDWIVRIVPAYHKGTTPEENPGQVTTPPAVEEPKDETCPECGDPKHEEGECHNPDCNSDVCHPGVGGDEGNGDEEDPTPGVGDIVKKGLDEVEINLDLDKKNDDLLESHLSIHVRSVTDVEVFIPVPAEYYCATDDMAIVIEHSQEFLHGGPYKTEYDINGNIVTLNVAFEDGGIRIWTDGINEDVIKYCWDKYQDGITFEVWTYFNNPETGLPYISMEELRGYLDQATVKFLDKVPDQYINSFGKDNGKYSEENPGGKDFHVTPEAQKDSFYDSFEGEHLNGSDNNDIYINKEKQKNEAVD